MANAQLSPPGSSVYSSDTMYVGDGTWDSSRNTFLLPNLQGLNLATTQYNGERTQTIHMITLDFNLFQAWEIDSVTWPATTPSSKATALSQL